MVHRLCESDDVIIVVPHFKLFVGVYVVLTVNLVLLFGKFYILHMDDHFEVVFHHGGKFINDGSLKYVGESNTLTCDSDRWSYFKILSILKVQRDVVFSGWRFSVGRKVRVAK